MALKMKGREQLTVIMLLWLWWGERNKWREEGRRRTAANLAYIAEFHADLASKTDGRLLSDFRQRTQWQRPRAGELKLNTDGAFNGDKHDGGWGFLIRDDQGRVLGGKTFYFTLFKPSCSVALLVCRKLRSWEFKASRYK
jgi:hypothetical protein